MLYLPLISATFTFVCLPFVHVEEIITAVFLLLPPLESTKYCLPKSSSPPYDPLPRGREHVEPPEEERRQHDVGGGEQGGDVGGGAGEDNHEGGVRGQDGGLERYKRILRVYISCCFTTGIYMLPNSKQVIFWGGLPGCWAFSFSACTIPTWPLSGGGGGEWGVWGFLT